VVDLNMGTEDWNPTKETPAQLRKRLERQCAKHIDAQVKEATTLSTKSTKVNRKAVDWMILRRACKWSNNQINEWYNTPPIVSELQSPHYGYVDKRTRRAEEQSMSQVVMSTGQAARELGVSQSLLRKLESIGVAPPAPRIAGLDRRLYSSQEVEALRQIITERRARVSQAEPVAAD